MMNTKRLIILSILLLISTLPLYARGQIEITEQKDTIEQKIDNETYYIKKIDYIVTGLVTEAALEAKLILKSGKNTFNSRKEFFEYIKIKELDLKNLRQLKNSSAITAQYEWNPSQERYDIVVKVFAIADFSILILPYFKYSSNSGFLLSARGRDYNFLGSLEPLAVNMDYTIDEQNRNSFGMNFSFSYPFIYKKNIFKLGIYEGFSYRDDERFSHNNTLSFNYNYQVADFMGLSASINQKFQSESDVDVEGKPIYSYGQNNISGGPSFSLNTTSLPVVGIFSYNPSVSFNFKYSVTPDDPNPEDRRATSASLNHSLNFGRIDWTGNFRQGLGVSLGNGYSYSFDDKGWSNYISLDTKFHTTAWDRLGFDMRVYGVHNFYQFEDSSEEFDDRGSNLGSNIRGVLDNNFKNARTALTVNTGISVRLFDIKPLASFHLGPTFDFGIRKHISNDFNIKEDIKYAVALEGLAFALFSRSIVVRASYGIDIGRAVEEQKLTFANKEIFFGLSLFY